MWPKYGETNGRAYSTVSGHGSGPSNWSGSMESSSPGYSFSSLPSSAKRAIAPALISNA